MERVCWKGRPWEEAAAAVFSAACDGRFCVWTWPGKGCARRQENVVSDLSVRASPEQSRLEPVYGVKKMALTTARGLPLRSWTKRKADSLSLLERRHRLPRPLDKGSPLLGSRTQAAAGLVPLSSPPPPPQALGLCLKYPIGSPGLWVCRERPCGSSAAVTTCANSSDKFPLLCQCIPYWFCFFREPCLTERAQQPPFSASQRSKRAAWSGPASEWEESKRSGVRRAHSLLHSRDHHTPLPYFLPLLQEVNEGMHDKTEKVDTQDLKNLQGCLGWNILVQQSPDFLAPGTSSAEDKVFSGPGEGRVSGWFKHITFYCALRASLVAQRVRHLPAMQETWVWSLDEEDPLEKEMTTHSSTLAWKIPWMEEPGRLQPMGSQRVRHDWTTSLLLYFYYYISSTSDHHALNPRGWETLSWGTSGLFSPVPLFGWTVSLNYFNILQYLSP